MKVSGANDNDVDTTDETIDGGTAEYIYTPTSHSPTANVHSPFNRNILLHQSYPDFQGWLSTVKDTYSKASSTEDSKNEENIADISEKIDYNTSNGRDDTGNEDGETSMSDNRVEAELLEVIRNTSNLKSTIIVTAIASVLAFAGIVVTVQIALQSSTQASFTALQSATMENFNARKDEIEAKNNALIMKVDGTLNEMKKENEIFKGEIKNILLQNKLDEQKK